MAMGGKGRFGKGKGKPTDKNKRRGNALFRRTEFRCEAGSDVGGGDVRGGG